MNADVEAKQTSDVQRDTHIPIQHKQPVTMSIGVKMRLLMLMMLLMMLALVETMMMNMT